MQVPDAQDTRTFADASLQTDGLPHPAQEKVKEWVMDEYDTVSGCAEVEEANEALRDELSRLEALYAGALYQLDAVRAALADEPAVLDATEQSQYLLVQNRLYDPWTGRSFPQVPTSPPEPHKSGALSRTVYTNDALSDIQYAAEQLVGDFVANDTVATETAEE
ncbi:hypothetical protein BN946_scf184805.g6 [Trametes cinnabarina]|uniref:Uncharacterized protein n=1 Tax=Pycnoporus cinnabarinus TaxID=5643 RepID=A0A060S353_PYCCI|nr:hypothetical protein BN946_scf184805.g6 [Trametes cinnabarina]